jgi:HK97 family phage portal protein
MRLFGLTVARTKTLIPVPSNANGVPGGTWFSVIREGFTGAWQRNIVTESTPNLLAFSAVHACVNLIASDIAKLRIKLMRQKPNGIWAEITEDSPFWSVLRKPNEFQTRVQFLIAWFVSKLLYGNTFVYKYRDTRGIVSEMYVLDPRLVTPLVTDSGDVYYQLRRDNLSGVVVDTTVPASEIIHDRALTLWHPLVGVSPITACAMSATQGLKIQNNSSKFFANMSRPSGHLTAPGNIPDATAQRIKDEFEGRFGGENIGKTLVTGDGMKYEPLSIPAEDAQLIEQLRWTVEDVARCFGIPLYKLGLAQPPASSIPVLNQDYYSQTLQIHIEAMEILLDEGLSLPTGPIAYGTELDLDGLLRMDPISRAERDNKEIGAGKLAPNEARRRDNLDPAEGGDTPYMQQQNYSLAALAKRDSQEDPFTTVKPQALPAPPEPDKSATTDETVAEKLTERLIDKFRHA